MSSRQTGLSGKESHQLSLGQWHGLEGRAGWAQQPNCRSPPPPTGYNVRASGIPVRGFKEKEGGKRGREERERKEGGERGREEREPALSTLPEGPSPRRRLLRRSSSTYTCSPRPEASSREGSGHRAALGGRPFSSRQPLKVLTDTHTDGQLLEAGASHGGGKEEKTDCQGLEWPCTHPHMRTHTRT